MRADDVGIWVPLAVTVLGCVAYVAGMVVLALRSPGPRRLGSADIARVPSPGKPAPDLWVPPAGDLIGPLPSFDHLFPEGEIALSRYAQPSPVCFTVEGGFFQEDGHVRGQTQTHAEG